MPITDDNGHGRHQPREQPIDAGGSSLSPNSTETKATARSAGGGDGIPHNDATSTAVASRSHEKSDREHGTGREESEVEGNRHPNESNGVMSEQVKSMSPFDGLVTATASTEDDSGTVDGTGDTSDGNASSDPKTSSSSRGQMSSTRSLDGMKGSSATIPAVTSEEAAATDVKTAASEIPQGVVIKVLIPRANVLFLHMLVYPSTTAGQVCRKIGQKLRLSPAELSQHVLVAVYPPASVDPGVNASSKTSGDGGDASSGDEGGSREFDGARGERVSSRDGGGFHGRNRRRRRENDTRRKGYGRDNASIRHILHTFHPEERIGESRLGAPGQPHSGRVGTDRGFPAAEERGDESQRVEDDEQYRDRNRGQALPRGRAGEAEQQRGQQNGGGFHGSGESVQKEVGGDGDGGALREALVSTSRWVFRDKRSRTVEAEDLPVEVSGSDTSEDESRAGWIDLWSLGQGHYCGYLLKKSRRDTTLWRRRWCILADDRLWLLRSKSGQSDRKRKGRNHTFSLPLVPCVVRPVSRSSAPTHCFELHSQGRVHLFRAESRAKQVAWVTTLHRQAKQAQEDSFISVAEDIVCDEEFARCRRLNISLSAALGSCACDILQGEFASSSPREAVGRRGGKGDGTQASPPLAVAPSIPLPHTLGLFRRDVVTRLTPRPTPSVHPRQWERKTGVSSHGDDGFMVGYPEVKRGVKFCAKVHRFKEICRPHSCVGIRKMWAYAAAALEELCPGVSDRNCWTTAQTAPWSSSKAPLRIDTNSASLTSASSNGSSNDGLSEGEREQATASPAVAVTLEASVGTKASNDANSSADAVLNAARDQGEVGVGITDSSVTRSTTVTKAGVAEAVGVGDQPAGTKVGALPDNGVEFSSKVEFPSAVASSLSEGASRATGTPVKAVDLPAVATPVSSSGTVCASQAEPKTETEAAATSAPSVLPTPALAAEGNAPGRVAEISPPAPSRISSSSSSSSSTSSSASPLLPLAPTPAVPVTDGRTFGPVPPPALFPVSQKGIVAVVQKLQDYRESVINARSRTTKSVNGVPQGGGARAGDRREASPIPPPAAPPEDLLDPLLDEVLQALGDGGGEGGYNDVDEGNS